MEKIALIKNISRLIETESEDNYISHLKVISRMMFLRNHHHSCGSVSGNNFTYWKTNLWTSIFYPVIKGEIISPNEIRLSIKINIVGKVIFFLICTLFICMTIFGTSMKYDRSISSISEILAFIIPFYLILFLVGYYGNKYIKKIILKDFNTKVKKIK